MSHTTESTTESADRPVPVMPLGEHELGATATGSHHEPHAVLGAHEYEGGVTVRTLKPFASEVAVLLPDGSAHAMEHEHDGIWTVALPLAEVPSYRIRVTWSAGENWVDLEEPYRFLPTIGELDLHLIREGRHEELWRALGAHVRTVDGVEGTAFAVWAPNARAVQVIGSFTSWDGRLHSMRSLGTSGVWELFVPGVGAGEVYKFRILGADGTWREKADPMARAAEVPPATGSVITVSDFEWTDDHWLAERASTEAVSSRMSIYEVHLASWRPGLGYRELAEELTAYVAEMGFTHVEFMPVAEHPFGGSWGYQVTGYYAPTSRLGSPDELRHLIDTLHGAGIGVIMDWVPAHFPKDEWALGRGVPRRRAAGGRGRLDDLPRLLAENFILPLSHDEVVHGKGSLLRKAPGDDWQQAATLRSYLTFQWTHPGKQLVFMGIEFAQGTEWSEQAGLPWWLLEYPLHRGAQQLVRDLNAVQAEFPALYQRDQDPGGFEWLIGDDAQHNVLSFVRRDEAGDPVVVVVNFSPEPWHEHRIPLPEGGDWLEVLNSDAPVYGGSGVGNLGRVHAEPLPQHGRDHSVRLSVPPLGAVVLAPARLREG